MTACRLRPGDLTPVRYRLGWWPLIPLVVVAVALWAQRPDMDLPPPPSVERARSERAAERIAETDFQEPKPPHVQGPARVIDGDTLAIGGVKVRLEGVSAPEMSQPGGADAQSALAQLIGRWDVYCALTGRRSYEREVGVCLAERGSPIHGADLGQRMVTGGWALPCPRYSRRYVGLEPRDGLVQRLGYRAPDYCATK
jgi:endonuclease YncB( thermonuclease family)